MKQDINYLKEKFQADDVPTAQDFADFMDSYVHKDDGIGAGLVNVATRGESEAGLNNNNVMTPLRTSQSIAALTRLSRLPNLRQDIINLILNYVDGDNGGGEEELPACSLALTITSFVKGEGNNYNVEFQGEGMTSIEWNIFDSVNTNVLTGVSPSPLTSNSFTIRAVLSSGEYRIVFNPTNCSSANASLRTKSFTVESATSFDISNVTIERFTTKLKATIVIVNPNNISLEYSKDNAIWQSSRVFDDLTETNKFYAREIATPANKVEFTKQDSLNSDWLVNEVKDYEVVSPEKLNQVDLRFIPDFEIPKRNGRYVIENILKGPNWRNQVTAVNFFMKGFTHIDELLLNLGTERQDIPYSNSFVSTMPLSRIVSVGGGANYPQLELGVNSDANEMNSISYTNYVDILNDYKFNVPQKFKGGDSVYKGAFIGFDLENGSFNLNLYDFVNRIVALHQALLDASSADTEVSLMYQSLPLQLVGFGVNRGHYGGTADATWTTPCSMTPNAQANNFPSALVGKSLKTLSSRMRCKFEYYMFYEAFLPEGTRLLNKQNTNLLNWQGNDISVLTHFGLGIPSYFHAFGHCAAGLGCQRSHLNGKSLMLQANHFNGAGNGYYYEQMYETVDNVVVPLRNQPPTTVLKQAFDGLGRYSAPNYIIAGQIYIAIFSGAIYYQWESNALITEEPRATGEQINQYPNPSYRDYRGVGAQGVAFRRLAAVKAKVGNFNVSIADLLDGNQIYTCEKVQVDYLNVSNYQGTKEVNPLDWIEYKLTPVMTIVNEVKGFIAIWACQAYGVEQSQVDVSYTKNGYNFKQRIQVPAGQNKLYIFSLTGTNDTPPTPPPSSGETIITVPDKPAYFFSDGHAPSYYNGNLNLPSIITNAAHPTPADDYVWMKNDKIKIAINLKRGGQIAWASLVDATENLVYNGYDGGFQITMDAYQVKDGYTQNGKVSHQQPNNGGPVTSYNTTMGGDFNNHSQTLIDYKRIGDSYYVKFRPIFYVMDSEWSEVIIEVKYTLDGCSVKCEYTYYSFRTDGQYDLNTFDGAACPACFIVNTLNRYQTYTGGSPWNINSPVEDGLLPIINQGGAVVGRHAKERWSCVYKPNSNKAIGIYMPTTSSSEYSNMKQMEVYAENGPGDEFTGGFTYFDMFTTFDNIVGNRSNYSKTIVANVIVAENPQKIREEVFRLAGR